MIKDAAKFLEKLLGIEQNRYQGNCPRRMQNEWIRLARQGKALFGQKGIRRVCQRHKGEAIKIQTSRGVLLGLTLLGFRIKEKITSK